jgi:RNA polymerase sigma factor (sigma-70 family)
MKQKQSNLRLLVTPPRNDCNESVPFQVLFRDSTSRNRLYLRIVECLDEMPELMRRAFVLRHYQGRSLSDLAEQTGMAEGDLVSLLHSAERRLQQALRHLKGGLS